MFDLVLFFLVAFVLLTVVSPFLPLCLMWRTAGLAVLALVAFRLLQAPVPEVAEVWELLPVAGFFGVVLTVRFGVAAHFGWLSLDALIGEKTAWLDVPILVIAGAIGGVVLTICLSYAFGESGGGRVLDLGVGLLGGLSAAGVFYIARRHLFAGLSVGAALLVLTVMSFVGSGQSLRILEEAEKMAAGRPWCISIPIWPERQGTMADLGFFSLPKQHGRPYLAIARDGRVETLARWSIRRQRFVVRKEDWAACEPQADFRTRLN